METPASALILSTIKEQFTFATTSYGNIGQTKTVTVRCGLKTHAKNSLIPGILFTTAIPPFVLYMIGSLYEKLHPSY